MTNRSLTVSKKRPKPLSGGYDYLILVNKFNEESLKNFQEKFFKLENNEDVQIITIIIDSYGGDVYSLLPMIDLLKTSAKPIATVALGKAMSCGAILLACGTKGYRFASETCDILIHEVASGCFGKNAEVQNDAKQTERLNKLLFSILTKHCGIKDKKFFQKKLKETGNVDWYLSAKEAKKLGLIDLVGIPRFINE